MSLTLLLSPLFGILTGLIPQIIKYLENRQQYKYQIEIAKLQIEASAKSAEQQKQIEDIKRDAIEAKSIYEHDESLNDTTAIGILRSSVRPITTYIFLLFFISAKIALVVSMLMSGLPIENIVPIILDEYTLGLFGTIMGFWFGTRSGLYQRKG